jgi:hypothetical protein
MKTTRAAITPASWRKSSYSNAAGAECVEVADGIPHAVPLRDSKNPTGPALLLSTSAWAAFITHLKAGTLSAQ